MRKRNANPQQKPIQNDCNFSANKRLEHQKHVEEARRQSIGSQIVGKVYPNHRTKLLTNQKSILIVELTA